MNCACQNDGCELFRMSYTYDGGELPSCAACGSKMAEIPAPSPVPPVDPHIGEVFAGESPEYPQIADPLVPSSVAVQTAVAAAMATVNITSPDLTDAQRQQIHDAVTAQVQGVVDQHLS